MVFFDREIVRGTYPFALFLFVGISSSLILILITNFLTCMFWILGSGMESVRRHHFGMVEKRRGGEQEPRLK